MRTYFRNGALLLIVAACLSVGGRSSVLAQDSAVKVTYDDHIRVGSPGTELEFAL